MFRRQFLAAVALGLTAAVAAPARADLVFSVTAASAAPGTTGNTLGVTLTNTSGTPFDIAAFQFRVAVPGGSGLTFTAADVATTPDPYIFGANGLAPPLSFDPFPATDVTASDVYAIPNGGITLAPGQTVGLGRLTFDVAGPAAGVVPVTLIPLADPLVDRAGNPLGGANVTFRNGSVTLAAVPEPAGVAVFGGLVAAGGLAARRRAAAAPVSAIAS